MAKELLVLHVRIQRAGRVFRGRGQARVVGGGWSEGLERPLSFLAAMGMSRSPYPAPAAPPRNTECLTLMLVWTLPSLSLQT